MRPGERDALSCYRVIAVEAAQHPAALSWRVLGVSRSGSAAWRGRREAARAQADARLGERIAAMHQASHGTSGSPRVHAELRATGERCGRRRVVRLMRQAGLRGCHGQRRRVRTPPPDRQATLAPARVGRAFTPRTIGAPARLWVAAISSGATLAGWLYLAVLLAAFSRRVVGWAMADHLRTELVLDALTMAIRHRQPAAGVSHHADHGGQSTSLAFSQRLKEAGLLPSMGSVGDCCANAVGESFFAPLKVERLHRPVWPPRAAALLAIFESIEVWDNRQRRQSSLGYLTPAGSETLAQEVAITYESVRWNRWRWRSRLWIWLWLWHVATGLARVRRRQIARRVHRAGGRSRGSNVSRQQRGAD